MAGVRCKSRDAESGAFIAGVRTLTFGSPHHPPGLPRVNHHHDHHLWSTTSSFVLPCPHNRLSPHESTRLLFSRRQQQQQQPPTHHTPTHHGQSSQSPSPDALIVSSIPSLEVVEVSHLIIVRFNRLIRQYTIARKDWLRVDSGFSNARIWPAACSWSDVEGRSLGSGT